MAKFAATSCRGGLEIPTLGHGKQLLKSLGGIIYCISTVRDDLTDEDGVAVHTVRDLTQDPRSYGPNVVEAMTPVRWRPYS